MFGSIKFHRIGTVVAILFGVPASLSSAQADVALLEGQTIQSALTVLPTGDQLLVEGQSGSVSFAGETLTLEDFSGLLGFASEAAYALVIDGKASIKDSTANRGRMIMIAPYGRGTAVERFDARRLHDALSAGARSSDMDLIIESLSELATVQDRNVFLGRMSRTNYNVATMNSAERETVRRARVGGTSIRAARFVGQDNSAISAQESRTIELFMSALIEGDAVAASQFLDPTPFGNMSLISSNNYVRVAAARAIIDQYDFASLSADDRQKENDTKWIVTSGDTRVEIELRRTDDFSFVQSVKVGN